MCYVVCWLLGGREIFLLWIDGGASPDYYVTSSPGAGTLLIAQNRRKIELIAHERHLTVQRQITDIFDLDIVITALSAMRPSRYLSARKAQLLLNAWNIFEDVSRSTKIDLMQIAPCDKQLMDEVYEKLFYGMNLPSITPNNTTYNPLFDANELRILRQSFRMALGKLPTLLQPS